MTLNNSGNKKKINHGVNATSIGNGIEEIQKLRRDLANIQNHLNIFEEIEDIKTSQQFLSDRYDEIEY